ncbi:hypothetical protein OWM54_08380 [Myxococcus sp. MISCRS1]|uniref:hypothetical protein n=1 Tax=Myxococcus sp. MISCRS1 TaxID=2996786 RepID=UPI00226FB3D2|nr:hypothetical protein [Myxococcus sp. MISCRS1]MCY0997159.1 hypothetical protein [Myxococcus sp. MISCRS1]
MRPVPAGELEGVGTFVDAPSGGGDGVLPGAFLSPEWESLVWAGAASPLEGAVAMRPVRRSAGTGPLRRPPLLNPRPSPAQAQARAQRNANLAVVLQARQLYQQRLKEAQATYPNSLGYENHHLIPMYLGGPANGQTYRLPTAYHKAITQAFRRKWEYGQGRRPEPQRLQDIMIEVYSQYPIPQLIGIEP